ncbi:MAG: hypothetical protein H8E55_12015 [Pelagibacterales bacterium]|nr:hypothetical protein [Pelagibacterales bacterium]
MLFYKVRIKARGYIFKNAAIVKKKKEYNGNNNVEKYIIENINKSLFPLSIPNNDEPEKIMKNNKYDFVFNNKNKHINKKIDIINILNIKKKFSFSRFNIFAISIHIDG